jgi:hypothetical protein
LISKQIFAVFFSVKMPAIVWVFGGVTASA